VVRVGTGIPEGSLAAGNPAEVKDPLKDSQQVMKDAGTRMYFELTAMYIETAKKSTESLNTDSRQKKGLLGSNSPGSTFSEIAYT